MKQPTLFPYNDRPPFVARDTSEAAADSIAAKAETLRARVFKFITERGAHGATDEEVQLALAMGGNTVRPRRRELELRELVRDSALRRKTRSGRRAIVWISNGGTQ